MEEQWKPWSFVAIHSVLPVAATLQTARKTDSGAKGMPSILRRSNCLVAHVPKQQMPLRPILFAESSSQNRFDLFFQLALRSVYLGSEAHGAVVTHHWCMFVLAPE